MEITFIPPTSFFPLFNFVLMLFVIITVYQCYSGQILRKDVAEVNSTFGLALTIFVILLMGLRPIHRCFGDTVNYARGFRVLQESGYTFSFTFEREWGFDNLYNYSAAYADIHFVFFVCSIIYTGCLYLALKKIFGVHYFVPLLVFLSMFTFWSYGVNGVRNGAAASLFILALANVNRLGVAALLAFCSIGFHKSMWMVVGAAIVAWYIKNSYMYIVGWFCSIVISFLAGMSIQTVIAGLGIFGNDDKFADYLTVSNVDFSYDEVVIGFRWDFIAFSALGILYGWYFIIKRKFKDDFYIWVFNIYCLANMFWIFVIRASYSNRIAQISWFILPLVLAYPTIKQRFWTDQEKYISYPILILFCFNLFYNGLPF